MELTLTQTLNPEFLAILCLLDQQSHTYIASQSLFPDMPQYNCRQSRLKL